MQQMRHFIRIPLGLGEKVDCVFRACFRHASQLSPGIQEPWRGLGSLANRNVWVRGLPRPARYYWSILI